MQMLLVFVVSFYSLIAAVYCNSCPAGSTFINFSDNVWQCFEFVTEKQAFLAAEQTCRNRGGHLISIHNAFENSFIAQTVTDVMNTPRFWVGVNDLFGNGWRFNDDDQNITFTDWAKGEPRINGTGCVAVNSRGYWFNGDCNFELSFVCEVPPVTEATGTTVFEDTTTVEPTTAQPTTKPSNLRCRSYIPFAVDSSTLLSATRFASMIDFLTLHFIPAVLPPDLDPTNFCSFDTTAHGFSRGQDIAGVIQELKSIKQGNQSRSRVLTTTDFFTHMNVLNYTNGLPVNTVIFAADRLDFDDVNPFIFSSRPYKAGANTMTLVLMRPDVDVTGYQMIPQMNIVTFSDVETTLSTILQNMHCSFQPVESEEPARPQREKFRRQRAKASPKQPRVRK